MTGGPIFMLRIYGLFLPCCENSEHKSARLSVQQLNALGALVDWHAGVKKSSPAGFVQSLFSRGKLQQQQHTDDKPPTPSQMKVVDATKDSINNGAPYPELQIKPLPKGDGDGDNNNNSNKKGGLGGLLKQNQSYQLDIPLHHIQRIESIDPTMIVIVTMDVHNTDDNATTKEAARISFSSSDDRDAASLDLKVLVEWNKNRQPDIEEDLPAQGIRARAQKAAHFAKRELEMRETKRSREQRKAKHMEGSSGLKYTAMAMANRATDS
jgi:hypothetical protein